MSEKELCHWVCVDPTEYKDGHFIKCDGEKIEFKDVSLDMISCPVCRKTLDIDVSRAIHGVFNQKISNVPNNQTLDSKKQSKEVVNPDHYRKHPSGVECIQIVEHMTFNLGNVVKYAWRADFKHESPIDDLKKAEYYIKREIERLSKNA